MPRRPPRVLVTGAHPDDAEFHCGALISQHRSRGHAVHLVAVTDGSAGHHELDRATLRARRRAESQAAAAVWDATCANLGFEDGALQPDLAVRMAVVRTIREFRPDLVVTHRTCDYHPDHRATAQAVQDAAYLIRVPAVLPDVPPLDRPPVIALMADAFTRPVPTRVDVSIDAEPWFEAMARMLLAHESQLFEWLPWIERDPRPVPVDAAARLDHVRALVRARCSHIAGRIAPHLPATAECYEVSEYGARLRDDDRSWLFGTG